MKRGPLLPVLGDLGVEELQLKWQGVGGYRGGSDGCATRSGPLTAHVLRPVLIAALAIAFNVVRAATRTGLWPGYSLSISPPVSCGVNFKEHNI